ncbi:MAG TPA: PrgI family protein [Candidatus Paceibacterota bacterium]|nr:PrgI family protein [Candidatus Paceibacterota bacterium]
MQFQVPQFIEVEDKIFGPLTFKQFVYILGGLGAAYLAWRVLPLFFAVPIILLVAGAAASLAFLEYNGRPFIISVENAFYFLIHPKLYLWNNERRAKKPVRQKEEDMRKNAEVYIPRLSESKLHDLSWSLDINERVAGGIGENDERVGGVVAPVRTAREALVR